MMNYELANMEAIEFMRTLKNKSVDACILDLPYGTTSCAWDEIIPFAAMWEQVERICKGAFITTASQPFTTKLIMSNEKQFKYEMIWNKGRGFDPQLANIRPMKSHENIMVFCKGKTVYNPQMMPIKPYTRRNREKVSLNRKDGTGQNIFSGSKPFAEKEYTQSFPLSVIDAGFERGEHPTQKPVALFDYLIRTYTNSGDTVLDFCMGSGTTGVACMQLGRNFIGCEIDPNYFEIAERRIKQAAAQEVMFT